jgi:hypothetical protein
MLAHSCSRTLVAVIGPSFGTNCLLPVSPFHQQPYSALELCVNQVRFCQRGTWGWRIVRSLGFRSALLCFFRRDGFEVDALVPSHKEPLTGHCCPIRWQPSGRDAWTTGATSYYIVRLPEVPHDPLGVGEYLETLRAFVTQLYFQKWYRVTVRRGQRYGLPPGVKQRHVYSRQELPGHICRPALATQVVVIFLVPALQMRLQPARGNRILAEPAYQYLVLRKVLKQVHGGSEFCF